jgi:tetratricopeptide (TPR) repeat protein/DNA-binding SARP family transcriptional activator
VEYRLLGHVTACIGDRELPLRGKPLAVLAALLYQPRRVVSKTELIRLVWGTEPADTAENLISDYVSRLRKIAEEMGCVIDLVTVKGVGVRIDADEETVDWHLFRRYAVRGAAAADAGDAAAAADQLWDGLRLWRGPALHGLGPSFDPLRRTMEERRVHTAELLAQIELDRGGAHRIAPVLDALAADHPTRESLIALRIRVLGEVGRRTEAMDLFHRSRQLFADELGLDLNTQMNAAYSDLLRSEPDRQPAPMQLPADPASFVGRDRELAELRSCLPSAAAPSLDRSTRGAAICAIYGMAGVGKTAFAIHAAHQIVRAFPDGQLFLNLHAFTANVSRVDTAEALHRLLRALGADDKEIPDHLEDRAALYRSRSAGRRMLIVLDNVLSAEQVDQLRPGGGDSLVIATSRRMLTALDDAHPIPLEPLSISEAVALLGKSAGAQRLTGHHDVAEHIAELCGGLPLAIQIIASRIKNRPVWSPQQVAQRLSAARGRLPELSYGERSAGAAFTLSYQDLTGLQRQLFRFVAITPGRDIDAYAAAALLDLPIRRATQLLEQLLDEHLLVQQVAGRYALHDLMREYGARRAEDEDPPEERKAALLRWLNHQLLTASAAMDVLYPHERARRPRLRTPSRPVFSVSTPPLARAWLDAERVNLIAAAGHAVDYGCPDYAWTIDAVLYRYLISGGHYAAALELHGYALAAARAEGSFTNEGVALGHFGRTYRRLGRLQESLDHARLALEAHRKGGDEAEQARMLTDIGIALGIHGRYDRGIEHLNQALELACELGLPQDEANILISLGNLHSMPGRHRTAIALYQRALLLYAETGDRSGEATTLANLGVVHVRLGYHDNAAGFHQRAFNLFTELGDRERAATALSGLGDAHRQMGQLDLALAEHTRALAIFRDVEDLHGVACAMSDLAATYAALGQLEKCPGRYREALRIVREIGDHTVETEILNRLGTALRSLGELDTALNAHREALAVATHIGNDDQKATAVSGIGRTLGQLGRPYEAHWYLRSAVGLLRELGVPEWRPLVTWIDRFDAD